MFNVVKRANMIRKNEMYRVAEMYAAENNFQLIEIEKIKGWGYCADFETPDGDWFCGYFIESESGDEVEIVFGSGQQVFDGGYVISDEDYYNAIGGAK